MTAVVRAESLTLTKRFGEVPAVTGMIGDPSAIRSDVARNPPRP